MAGISFESDLDFLKEHTKVVQLACTDRARTALGDSVNHVHRTCRFEGPLDGLNDLSMRTLGVDLKKSS